MPVPYGGDPSTTSSLTGVTWQSLAHTLPSSASQDAQRPFARSRRFSASSRDLAGGARVRMDDTLEGWSKWCERAGRATVQLPSPPWRSEGDVAAKRALEDRLNRERAQMQRILQQGLHQTKLARSLAHLPKNLSSEAVQRSRKDALEVVEKRTRRIRKALSETARHRHDLQGCIHALQAVKDANNKAQLESYVHDRSSFFFGLKRILTVETVNTFCESHLPRCEHDTRTMSRALGVSIPDAEVIRSHFDKFDTDGKGIRKHLFPKLVESLNGKDSLSDVQINAFFRTIDKNSDGRISFSEYLVWHLETCGAPRLSQSMKEL